MQRRSFTISGIVQGVGFRPFVCALARQFELNGFVQNRSGQVRIEVEGSESALVQFADRLQSPAPPLARIDQLTWRPIPVQHDRHFRILDSDANEKSSIFVSPDISTCSECRDELFDPGQRRYGYPFINCTRCGPRLTIIHRAPYDRINTTMAAFAMCDRCRAEYNDPNDRRFHAQPIACPDCGPRLQLLDERGQTIESVDPIGDLCDLLGRQQIAAVKGVGGYHLVCDAGSDLAVRRLRQRKHRDEKPFAVMVRDLSVAAQFCLIGQAERELLTSQRRPIVLVSKRFDGQGIADAVAPNNPRLGVMLPCSPLHEWLLSSWGDRGLVMTSGNRHDEPIAYQDSDAIERLSGIADQFLIHNRPIRVRCDDSVTQLIGDQESLIRRSRGYAPLPIRLPRACPQPMLAVGGQQKNVFAIAAGEHVFLSQHMGDLDHWTALDAFARDIDLYQQLFDIAPRCIVHDLHPEYASTKYALRRSGSGFDSRLGGAASPRAHGQLHGRKSTGRRGPWCRVRWQRLRRRSDDLGRRIPARRVPVVRTNGPPQTDSPSRWRGRHRRTVADGGQLLGRCPMRC